MKAPAQPSTIRCCHSGIKVCSVSILSTHSGIPQPCNTPQRVCTSVCTHSGIPQPRNTPQRVCTSVCTHSGIPQPRNTPQRVCMCVCTHSGIPQPRNTPQRVCTKVTTHRFQNAVVQMHKVGRVMDFLRQLQSLVCLKQRVDNHELNGFGFSAVYTFVYEQCVVHHELTALAFIHVYIYLRAVRYPP